MENLQGKILGREIRSCVALLVVVETISRVPY